MTNTQVAQAFIDRQEGQSENMRTLQVMGGATILYSYATPVAYISDGSMAFDARKYSVTTSKQVTLVRNLALKQGHNYTDVEHKDFREQLKLLGVYTGAAR